MCPAVDRMYRMWNIVAAVFLAFGILCLVAMTYMAITGFISCPNPGGCTEKSASDILLGQLGYLATFCAGFILLAIGATILVLFRWGTWPGGRRRRLEDIRRQPPP